MVIETPRTKALCGQGSWYDAVHGAVNRAALSQPSSRSLRYDDPAAVVKEQRFSEAAAVDPAVVLLCQQPAARGRCVIESVLDTGPGPESIATLTAIDPLALDDSGRLLLVEAWERQSGWLAVQQQRVLVAAGEAAEVGDADDPAGLASDFLPVEVATRLGVSHQSAQRRIAVAEVLNRRLRFTRSLLEAGRWTMQHVSAMVDETETLSDEQARWVDHEVVTAWQEGHATTPSRVRARAKRARIAVDAFAAELAHARAAETTTEMAHYPSSEGMSTLETRLPADDAQVVWKALTARGRTLRDAARQAAKSDSSVLEPPRRDLAYWRARALVDLADQALADPKAPTFQGKRRVEIGVVVSLDTLLRLDENPAELTGYGPIPAQVARDLAGDAEWRRWVSEPVSGHLLDYGRTTYRPPQELVDYLLVRDNTCTFPGCSVPAWRCDLDHSVAWSEGGDTAAWCMGAVCRRHHNHRTHGVLGRWRISRDRRGGLQWISPLGVVHRIPPRQVLPLFTHEPPVPPPRPAVPDHKLPEEPPF